MKKFNWKICNQSSQTNARTGIITTPHGNIHTPAFIFCGTKAALKSISVEEAKKCNTQIILSNTYHLMLQPGSKIISDHGGLHKFMNWKGPMLTDSGGFQIFSLGHGSVADEIKGKKLDNKNNKSLVKVIEEGALFKSYVDGSNVLLTPEKSIETQRDIGADLILVLDECTPYHVDKTYTAKSMERSHRWAIRSINSFNNENNYDSCKGSSGLQALYGIIQGGIYNELREASIDFNKTNSNFFGIAIGGSLGSSKDQMYEIVQYSSTKLDNKKPVHLLGIGDQEDIWELVKSGVDTFDCVNPTRLARHGMALMPNKKRKLNIRNARYKEDILPIDDSCNCLTCKNYSRAYIYHLFKSKELLGFQLITLHNIFFMNKLMKYIREAIDKDNIIEAEKKWYKVQF